MDSRCRVVVVGGGLSGLTAAYELSRTPELRARFAVQVVQSGFRLGGKLASGRNRGAADRNEEHGLHVWFGFYTNAFALGREVYHRWRRPPGCPLRSFWDVVEPCSYAPFGRRQGDRYDAWTVLFPRNDARPGDAEAVAPSTVVLHLLDAVGQRVRMLRRDLVLAPEEVRRALPADVWKRVAGRRGADLALAALDAAFDGVRALLAGALRSVAGGLSPAAASTAYRLVHGVAAALLPTVERATRHSAAAREHVYYPLDFCLAALRALFDPRYGVARDWNLDRLNHLELRELLQACGLSSETAAEFVLIRGCYDAFFQFVDGDVARPDFEAGTALRIALRALLLYRGAAFWLFNVGVGEGLIAPLYRVLRDQGVEFRFFHELVDVELAPETPRVDRLWFVEQARPRAAYAPTFQLGGLECWPTEPLWDQLIDGEALRAAGCDLEAPTRGPARARRTAWTVGQEFDAVVLALPLGVLTDRGGAPSPVQALLDRDPRLARLCAGINLVPSIAAQLWLDRSPHPTGPDPRPAMLAWAYPWDIWADMSPTLAHESWPGPHPPRAALYLCGTATSRVPGSADPDRTRREETVAATAALADQLARHGPALFPPLRADDGGFAWDSLTAPPSARGRDRLAAQYVRVNALPSDLCDGAATGSSSLRLEADSSGLDNLVYCGTWTRTGINTTCVEAAVMAGMAAARGLARDARPPVADRFMQAPAHPQPPR